MILKNAPVHEFAEHIKKNDKKLILFGAGTLLQSWIPYMLESCGIGNQVELVMDNAREKQGSLVRIGERSFAICNVERMTQKLSDRSVILITSSYFASMIEQLDSLEELKNTECYVAPIMHLTNPPVSDSHMGMWKSEVRRIPPIIHYCWFGRKPMPERNRLCIESWKRYCPDYQIMEWNEDNYDLGKNRYMKQAYDAGKYGYVPDYARIDLLYEYGGIYMDTDVELLKSLDDLLYLHAYTSFEEYPTINFGGGSGSVKGFGLLKEILDFRKNIEFIKPDGSMNKVTCGYYESVPLERAGLRLDGTLQNVGGMTIFPSEYFHPKSSVTGRICRTENTYSVHQFNWSWVEGKQLEEKKKTHKEFEALMRRIRENS
jgi:hypothetical protein